MALFKTYQPYTRFGHYELDGLISRLTREIDEHEGVTDVDCYVGARIAMSIARYHEFVDTQEDFMRLFEHMKALEKAGAFKQQGGTEKIGGGDEQAV